MSIVPIVHFIVPIDHCQFHCAMVHFIVRMSISLCRSNVNFIVPIDCQFHCADCPFHCANVHFIVPIIHFIVPNIHFSVILWIFSVDKIDISLSIVFFWYFDGNNEIWLFTSVLFSYVISIYLAFLELLSIFGNAISHSNIWRTITS